MIFWRHMVSTTKLMKSLKDIVIMEHEVATMVTELVSKLASDTREIHIDGVRNLGKNTAVVSASNLSGNILCPYYYLQSAQADIVQRKLQSVKTATGFIDTVREMTESKQVKIGSEKYHLNPHTIKVLQSYLENA